MNNENLKKFTKENAKEMGKKGGIKSGIVRTERQTMKEQMQLLLSLGLSDKEKIKEFKEKGFADSEINNQLLLTNSIYNSAINGNMKAVDCIYKILQADDIEKEKSLFDFDFL